ncbi:unannotated protein [freshwater metagenome]|uniref:Unannotated protein n=1 Tax=freshwater metagenome TaxID=449393 RepID=A0A6J7FTV2_9ZZZZ
MLFLLLEGRHFLKAVHDAVDAGSRIALGLHGAEEVRVFALALPHHRCQNLKLGALGQFHDAIHDLLRCLPGYGATAIGAMRLPDARVEQAEVVVDLSHGAYSGSWVAGGGLLINRDGRRQTLNKVNIRLIHLAEKLSRI